MYLLLLLDASMFCSSSSSSSNPVSDTFRSVCLKATRRCPPQLLPVRAHAEQRREAVLVGLPQWEEAQAVLRVVLHVGRDQLQRRLQRGLPGGRPLLAQLTAQHPHCRGEQRQHAVVAGQRVR